MTLTAKEQANNIRWDGKRPGWFEVYFLKWNDPKSQTAAWIRYTFTIPSDSEKQPYCELWGVFFDAVQLDRKFAIKKRYPFHQLAWSQDPFSLDIGDAFLGMYGANGEIIDQDRGHHLTWDLKFDSQDPPLFHFPYSFLYKHEFPRTKVVAPHVNARFSGKLSVDGKEINLEQAPGQQEHLWGTKHAFRYTWGHCNSFTEDPLAVWEGLDAQIRLGPVTCPRLKLFYLKSQSGEYLFNSPLKLIRNHSSCGLGFWDFMAQDRHVRLVGRLRCSTDRFVGLTYTDPDGEILWCNNSKLASIELQLYGKNGKCIENLTSNQACAIEHTDRLPHPLVPIEI